MDIKTYAAYLINSLGQVRGKKAFQKLVYLAKAEGVPLNYSYKMHFYGPYSENIAERLEEIYKEDVIDLAPDSSFIFTKGTKTELVLHESKEEIDTYKNQLDKVIQYFGEMSPKELEIYATAHFVWKAQLVFNQPTDKNTVIDGIKKAKYPKFSVEEIEKAYNDLFTWNLIN
ncbi:MAG: hypothetical protein PHZ03_07320 [Syntrophomonas sp.]|nr:hypothetical protein [Syntrophomonas sp.]